MIIIMIYTVHQKWLRWWNHRKRDEQNV